MSQRNKISSRLFICRHRRKSGSNRVCGGRGKGLQPWVSREAQLAVLLRRRFLHLASLLGCQTGATSSQELYRGTPFLAIHHRSQSHTGASTLASTHQPPTTSLLCGANCLRRGACLQWWWLLNLLKTQGYNLGVCQVVWVNVWTSPRKNTGELKRLSEQQREFLGLLLVQAKLGYGKWRNALFVF